MAVTAENTFRLRRILGLGFGLAMAFGTMVGVGILRLPGTVAAAVGDPTLAMLVWVVGALYALLGAVSISELAALYPEAGGMRVYARQAFGNGVSFVVGWIDWLASVATLAYAAVTVAAFLENLWPGFGAHESSLGIALLVLFAGLHWIGLRTSSTAMMAVSALVAVLMAALVVACFIVPLPRPAIATGVPHVHLGVGAVLLATIPAIRAVVTAYDGWYAPIYMAEENADPARTLPRALIGTALAVAVLYLLINLALLHVLTVPQLAASTLPAAAAAQLVLPRGGALLITLLAVLTVLNLLNGNMLMAPRVLFSLAREGWIPRQLALVSASGAPRVAVAVTTAAAIALVATGTFNQIVALFAVLILLFYCVAFLALFVLRWRRPELRRPYRAFGYPVSTAIVLAATVAFLVASAVEDPRSAFTAALFLVACVPAFLLAKRLNRRSSSASSVLPAR